MFPETELQSSIKACMWWEGGVDFKARRMWNSFQEDYFARFGVDIMGMESQDEA